MLKQHWLSHMVVIVLCIALLMPLLVVGQYSHPCVDDYDYSLKTHRAVQNGEGLLGVLKAAWETNVEYFQKWQGLYTSGFLLSLQPGIFGTQYYPLTMLLAVVSIALFLFGAMHLINRMYLQKSALYSLAWAMAMTAMLLLWLPSPAQGLYWFNAAFNYTPWIFASVFNVCLLHWACRQERCRRAWMAVAASTLLSILISGANHVTSFANILMLLCAAGYWVWKKRWEALLPLAAACIGFVVMFTAPGTAQRAAQDGNPQTVVHTVIAVVKEVRNLAHDWMNVQWLLSLLAMTPLCLEVARRNKASFSRRFPIAIIVAAAAIICGMMAVPYYPMGFFGEGRVTNVIWIAFMLFSWLIYACILGFLVSNDYLNAERMVQHRHFRTVMLGMVCAALLLSAVSVDDNGPSNSLRAVYELKNGTAQTYGQLLDEREEKYLSDEYTEVIVDPLPVVSELLYYFDVGFAPNEWPSTGISEYYGKTIWCKLD